jgi:pyruvate/2-oxoglutarate/acetoin dehydrogenase E1 component
MPKKATEIPDHIEYLSVLDEHGWVDSRTWASMVGRLRITEDLLKAFGEERVLDTPWAESGIVGFAIGMALYGLKPVCEISFSGEAAEQLAREDGAEAEVIDLLTLSP